MPKVTEARLEIRRQQILEAAIACFALNGFHQTTMADIAAEAGVSPGAIYLYFASKEDVVEASVQARRQAREARFQAAHQKQGTLEILFELIDLQVKRVSPPDPNVSLSAQTLGEAQHNPRVRNAVRSVWDDLVPRIGEIIRRGQERGEINPALDPDAVARLIVVAGEGLIVHKTVDPDMDVRGFAEALKALIGGDFWRGRPVLNGKG